MRSLLLMLAVACGSPSKPVEPVKPVEPAQRVEPPAPPAPVKATFAGVPDTVAGEHLAWILSAVAKDGVVTKAEVERRLHASFLAAVPADKFVAVTKSLAALNPLAVTSVEGNELTLLAKLTSSKGPLLAIVNVDAETKQVTGMVFKPDTPTPKTFGEALQMAEKLAPQAQLLVAELDAKGTCKPLHATASKQPLAIGSTFKL